MEHRNYAWAGTAEQLAQEDDAELTAALKEHHASVSGEMPSDSNIRAWLGSIDVLREATRQLPAQRPASDSWIYVLEYELPRERGRRPDLTVLAGPDVVVVEFKAYSVPEPAHIDQVTAYARDLSEYHEETRGRTVTPILCLVGTVFERTAIRGVDVVSGVELALAIVAATGPDGNESPIQAESWLASDYAPRPSLVQAARTIFRDEPLPHIRRAESAGIPEALAILKSAAEEAHAQQQKHLALVAGVPGSGKTLVGLQFVYERHDEDSDRKQTAVFLSGNGPLVKVLQYTLGSKVFVRDVLGFLKTHGGSSALLPHEHIWVFDEAQRAFDAKMAKEKQNWDMSEPENFLNLGNKLASWCLMVGLIGEGQEINRGEEAGLIQWNDALIATDADWTVHCPPRLAPVFGAAAETRVSGSLDLDTSLRSHRAEDIHEWVRLLLEGQIPRCKTLARRLIHEGFSMYVTREVAAPRLYAQDRYARNPDARYGLLASAKAKNLSPHGFLNDFAFTQNMRIGPWFADPPESDRSCCSFRETATEFQCQGLELDMPIIGWGDDFVWEQGRWVTKRGLRSRNVVDPQRLRENAYRVLLTRGRDGIAIFVPPESSMDATFNVLLEAGCAEMRIVSLGYKWEV